MKKKRKWQALTDPLPILSIIWEDSLISHHLSLSKCRTGKPLTRIIAETSSIFWDFRSSMRRLKHNSKPGLNSRLG